MNYEEKKEAKIKRYRELAENNIKKSENSYNQSSKLSEFIPMGQPILIGHHSENTHRNPIKKIHNQMDKSIQYQSKATYYINKIKSAENNNIISSDDPEGINKLQEKLKRGVKMNNQQFIKWYIEIMNQEYKGKPFLYEVF